MIMPGPFVLATTNPHKLREIAEIFDSCGLRIPLLGRPSYIPDIEETGDTFLSNARLKAAAVAQATGRPAVAEDSGLEVDALLGAPGVRSARYAGEPSDDQANIDRLLTELAGFQGPQRR